MKLFNNKESAKDNAMLQSSVHILCAPYLGYIYLFYSTSLKSNLILSFSSFLNELNYVQEPRASPIANPKKQATAL